MPLDALRAYQPSLPALCGLEAAVETLATASAADRGAIFTRPEVVEFILDLVGYTPDRPLARLRLLEPSFGGGDFLRAAVRRLVQSYNDAGGAAPAVDLAEAIRGVELHRATFAATAAQLTADLEGLGLTSTDATLLVQRWLSCDDFLLAPIAEKFDVVVGNPPYIRQELIPQSLIDEYRRRYATVYDRADIYIPFIERSLDLLTGQGVLGFICADRWTKNRYGGPLRKRVAERFHLRAYVDMVDTPAFLSDVVAYPGIFVIGAERGEITRIARRPVIEAAPLSDLAKALTGQPADAEVHAVGLVTGGSEPWLLEGFDSLEVVRRLEAAFPTLEEAGCKVGIGVATGNDEAFIGPLDALDVEPDRKVPLVMTRDIHAGDIRWRGLGVINPFKDEGGLVSLTDYPRLGAYLEARREAISRRHVARKSPANWYRTIDRISPELVGRPKLLIPDIKGEAHIVYDEGRYYPHHNLYFITSETWDLRALQAVLLSGIARLFVATYSTKMRGGYLRFQAQYLRRIRVPRWEDVSLALRAQLTEAAERRDQVACNAAVAELYRLTAEERLVIGLTGDGDDA
ncbi:modification methylase PaeR7I [Brevundimonas sp. EAKA]|uniref:Eco57I restriction-modification methylase domain-containing protein n=1 Tax=Brevundimonas sp. EAKA TaxID=1495854 RepID=UPI0004A9A4F7|nr:Eco57I restriction-modification methylase domain-containing protein [Brevundimonas sp. EAKA]KDP95413.1 modification methylase PaeR7I [Brevundimonas sp. EAKA]